MESDSHGNLFREFAIGLETAIKKAFPARMPKRSAKEKVLSRFHSLSLIFVKLYHQIGKDITVDRMMKQYTNDKIFTEMYVSQFSTSSTTGICPTSTRLTIDEENIVRYVAGYVPLKLMRKYEKQASCKAAMFVETLKVSGQEVDFAAYATRWIEEVNCGGLYEVNESA